MPCNETCLTTCIQPRLLVMWSLGCQQPQAIHSCWKTTCEGCGTWLQEAAQGILCRWDTLTCASMGILSYTCGNFYNLEFQLHMPHIIHSHTCTSIHQEKYSATFVSMYFWVLSSSLEGRSEISSIWKRSSQEANWIEDKVSNLVHYLLMYTSHFALECSEMQFISTYWKRILDGRQGMIT
jgi:hypothetical protein